MQDRKNWTGNCGTGNCGKWKMKDHIQMTVRNSECIRDCWMDAYFETYRTRALLTHNEHRVSCLDTEKAIKGSVDNACKKDVWLIFSHISALDTGKKINYFLHKMIHNQTKHKKFCMVLFTLLYGLLLSTCLQHYISSFYICYTLKYFNTFFSRNVIHLLRTPMLNKMLVTNTQCHSLHSTTCYYHASSVCY